MARLLRLVVYMPPPRPFSSAPPSPAPVPLTLLLALLGCNGPATGGPDSDPPSTAATGAIGPAEQQDTTPDADRPICLQADRYVASGTVPVAHGEAANPDGSPAARRIAGLRWERHDGCERFVVDLTAQDGGTAGDVRAELLRGVGVLRVTLTDVETVDADATDAHFDGPLARSAYLVRSPDGTGTYVDLHLGQPADAHVLLLSAPARVVVDLRPGGGPVGSAAATNRRVVVLKPAPGPASYPLTVAGYARTFEANVVVRLEQAGQVVHESFTTATAWADAWGHYSLTVPDGPAGPTRLHVGEYSARDGTWEGAAIDVDMRTD